MKRNKSKFNKKNHRKRGKIDTPKNDTFIYLFEHIFLSLD